MGNPSSGPRPGLQQRDAEPAAAGLGAVAGWRGQQDGAEQAGQCGLPSPGLYHAVSLPWASRRPSCCHFGCQVGMHAGLKQGEPARGLALHLALRGIGLLSGASALAVEVALLGQADVAPKHLSCSLHSGQLHECV